VLILCVKGVSLNKIFGIGLSRTGTASLTSALQSLGYLTAHFPCDRQTQTEIYDYRDSPNGLHLTILDAYGALTDTPVCCTYKALDRHYPNSKYILTVRSKDTWLRSCEVYWRTTLVRHIENSLDDIYPAFIDYVNLRLYGTSNFDANLFSKAYDEYVNGVLSHFEERPSNLLIMNICEGDGWFPLCDFLSDEIPSLPFPHDNRTNCSH
jgi:hypothetical protein